MKFMILVKGNATSEAGSKPDPAIVEAMTDYHEELARAGALLDASGLKPTRDGWRVRYSRGKPTVVDGPFTETKEIIAGYTLIQAATREEALEWTRRFPAPFGENDCEIEVRPLYELDEVGSGEAIERFRELMVNAHRRAAGDSR